MTHFVYTPVSSILGDELTTLSEKWIGSIMIIFSHLRYGGQGVCAHYQELSKYKMTDKGHSGLIVIMIAYIHVAYIKC